MARYGLSWQEMLALPIRAFWGLFRQIAVLNAEENLRQLRLMGLSHTSDENALKEYVREQERLIESAIIPDLEVEAEEGRKALRDLAAKLK